MRRIRGDIAFPTHAATGVATRITIELRDVSMQDQASAIVASKTMDNVRVGASQRVAFGFEAPMVAADRSLSMRVQVDMHPDQRHASGDFLSTVAIPVAAAGDVEGLVVPVTQL